MSKRIAALMLFTFAAAASARAADFDSLVRIVSSQPGMHRVWTPGISLARLGIRIVHPAGVHDMELAVFEGDGRFDRTDFQTILLTSREHPMVQTHSNRTGETSVIWARPMGRDLMELVILAHDPKDETVVIRTVVDGEMLAREIADPKHGPRIAR